MSDKGFDKFDAWLKEKMPNVYKMAFLTDEDEDPDTVRYGKASALDMRTGFDAGYSQVMDDYVALKEECNKLKAQVQQLTLECGGIVGWIKDEFNLDIPTSADYDLAEVRAQAVDGFAAAQMEVSHEKRACGQNDLADIYHDNANDAIVFAKRIRAAAKGEGVSDAKSE